MYLNITVENGISNLHFKIGTFISLQTEPSHTCILEYGSSLTPVQPIRLKTIYHSGEGNLFFCCTCPNPNFRQIKLIIIVITHINIFFVLLIIVLIVSFFLGYNEIDKKVHLTFMNQGVRNVVLC